MSAKASSKRRYTGPRARSPERRTSSTSSSSRPSRYGRANGVWRTATIDLRAHCLGDGVLEEIGEALVATLDGGEEHLLDLLGDRAAPADLLTVHRCDRRHLGSGAAQEGLIREIEIGAHQRRHSHLESERLRHLDHALARDAR